MNRIALLHYLPAIAIAVGACSLQGLNAQETEAVYLQIGVPGEIGTIQCVILRIGADGRSLTLAPSDRKTLQVMVGADTSIQKDGKKASMADLKTGQKATVTFVTEDDHFHAKSIVAERD